MLALLRYTLDRRDVAVDESMVLESVLIVGESIITHRRRHQGRAQVDTVLDLLLLDRENPRSVALQLDRLAEDLAHLPDQPAAACGAARRRCAGSPPGCASSTRRPPPGSATAARPHLIEQLDALIAELSDTGRRPRARPLRPPGAVPAHAGDLRMGAVSRRYDVSHSTRYSYDEVVTASYGRAHLVPRDGPGQVRETDRLVVEPLADLTRESDDFYGNRSVYVEVHTAHTELVVTALSRVQCGAASAGPRRGGPLRRRLGAGGPAGGGAAG